MRISKIISFSVVIFLITVVFAGAVTVLVAAQPDTMQFRYNAAHTGDYSPVAGTNVPNNILKWKSNISAGADSQRSPVYANGVIYVSTDNNGLYALNATTGAKLWNFSNGSEASPAVANGLVYVGVNNPYPTLELSALYANNATVKWSRGIADGSPTPSSCSAPTVANGVVYVGNEEGYFYAINASNGSLEWQFYAHTGTTEPQLSSPAVANGVVYFGSADNNVWARNATSGAKLWNFTAGGSVTASPAVANGLVYVGDHNNTFYALDAITGHAKWKIITKDWVQPSAAVANGVVYIGSDDGNLYVANATTGQPKWAYVTNTGGTTSPAIANGVVYIGGRSDSTHNLVLAINATTGALPWTFPAGDFVGAPAVANGVVYVECDDGNLYAIGNGTTAALNATAPSTASITQNFTINGNLSAGTVHIANATITLRRSTDNVTFTNVTTNKTNATGGYAFSKNEKTAGSYYYQTAYAGNATLTNATSNVVKVTVTKIPTALTATAPATATVSKNFTVTGKLTVNGTTTGVGNATLTLLKYNATSGKYNITIATTKTNTTTGAYTFTVKETKVGTDHYEVTYAGNTTYLPKTSAAVTVVMKYPTTLTATAPAKASIGKNITVTGRLLNGTTSLTGQNVTLQRSLNNSTWVTVTGKTNTTNATGGYTLTTKEPTAGTYYYRGYYTGNATYAAATSKGVKVVVS